MGGKGGVVSIPQRLKDGSGLPSRRYCQVIGSEGGVVGGEGTQVYLSVELRGTGGGGRVEFGGVMKCKVVVPVGVDYCIGSVGAYRVLIVPPPPLFSADWWLQLPERGINYVSFQACPILRRMF